MVELRRGALAFVVAATAACSLDRFPAATPPSAAPAPSDPAPASRPVASKRAAEVRGQGFERTDPGSPPRGFDASSGGWVVADSPTALSGRQVVSRTGEAASWLVSAGEAKPDVRAEVGVRVILGSAGAGLACSTGPDEGRVVAIEPAEKRVALYRVAAGSAELLATHEGPLAKGEWLRLGLQCRATGVVATLGGREVLRSAAGPSASRPALWSGAGATAQFDDFVVTAFD